MNWLSQEEIKRRAAISDEEALNVSIESWEQKCEVLKQGGGIDGHYGSEDCGLCCRYHQNCGRKCPGCVLDDGNEKECCCLEWRNFFPNPSLTNAQAMLNRLYMERGKMYGKDAAQSKKGPCKKEEPELRHGDYGITACGDFFVLLDGKVFWKSGESGMSWSIEEMKSWTVFGNIFDDLKRNSEDLRRASIDGFVMEIIGDRICIGGRRFLCHQASDFHQKLGQLIATAKREQAKKKDC